MIVEDALVINESCACEIVKAAITASHADAAMIKQIVQTAVAVAPKMAPVIMECSGASKEEDKAETVSKAVVSGKDAKNVLPEAVVPPKEDGGSDYASGPGDIRGIYLMQPAVGGPGTTVEVPIKTPRTHDKPRTPRNPEVTPMSPSCSCVSNT
jgi:hypothetical protein